MHNFNSRRIKELRSIIAIEVFDQEIDKSLKRDLKFIKGSTLGITDLARKSKIEYLTFQIRNRRNKLAISYEALDSLTKKSNSHIKRKGVETLSKKDLDYYKALRFKSSGFIVYSECHKIKIEKIDSETEQKINHKDRLDCRIFDTLEEAEAFKVNLEYKIMNNEEKRRIEDLYEEIDLLEITKNNKIKNLQKAYNKKIAALEITKKFKIDKIKIEEEFPSSDIMAKTTDFRKSRRELHSKIDQLIKNELGA